VLNAPVEDFWSRSNVSCSALGSGGGAGEEVKGARWGLLWDVNVRERRRGEILGVL
jgi:hypothetical protein